VGEKANAKIQTIQKADADLLDAPTVQDQRRIIVNTQKEVEDITSGAASTGGPKDGTEAPVPGHPGVIAVYRGGRWVVK
jgi:hypothetical protein